MQALRGDAEAHGAMIAFETPVVAGLAAAEQRLVIETGGRMPMRVAAAVVVNAAGLGAQAVARSIAGMPADKIPPLHLAKGNYFSLIGRSPFSRLIYPMPTPAGLGVHLTLDLAGQAKFGPDVEWVDAIDYDVDPRRAESFYAAIRTYWPDLPDGSLQPGYAGIRPKIARPGGSNTDFLIQTEKDHGIAGLINLFGIESPGLTASLAIADGLAHRRGQS
jgi:L-2-hydroxyglutarate oxidase LhgO